jgi:hypothetical protein
MLNLLINFITDLSIGDVEVSFERDSVTFRSKRAAESVALVFYVSAKPRGKHVIAVGEVPGASGSFERIDLVDGRLLNSEELDQDEIMEAFLRFGFAKLANGRTFMRPRVVFCGVKLISKALAGAERVVLSVAARKAGAREVIFK